jgi:hypothetical protein
MPRTPAKITQADVARTIRAAMQAGAAGVEVRRDGSIVVLLRAAPSSQSTEVDSEPRKDVVL